jgi:hypothetical protein
MHNGMNKTVSTVKAACYFERVRQKRNVHHSPATTALILLFQLPSILLYRSRSQLSSFLTLVPPLTSSMNVLAGTQIVPASASS